MLRFLPEVKHLLFIIGMQQSSDAGGGANQSDAGADEQIQHSHVCHRTAACSGK